MLDIKIIRENPEEVIQRLSTRNKDYSTEINQILSFDKERRNLISATESVKAHKNEISKKNTGNEKAKHGRQRSF